MSPPETLDINRLNAVLRTALDAVVVMRLDGSVAGWNHVAEQTFGWSHAEVLGRPLGELIIPVRHRDGHDRGLAHYLETGEGPVLDQRIEIDARHRDGHEIPVELSITRTNDFGEPVFLGFLRDISGRRAAKQQQKLLVDELNHRIKNLFGVVSGVAHLTVRSSNSLEEFSQAFFSRLASMARAQEILTEGLGEHGSMKRLVEETLAPYLAEHEERIAIAGPDVQLEPKQLINFGMIVHELTANAVKYGALSRAQGQLSVSWQRSEGRIIFHWTESGLSDVKEPARMGFGSRMIQQSASHSLRGKAHAEWREHGLNLSLEFEPV